MRLPLVITLFATALAVPALSVSASTAAPDPTHTVSVTGAGVTTWPSYGEGVDRFAMRSSGTVSSVTVAASSREPAARVTVNGRQVTTGEATVVDGLTPGDEVNVQITDSAGTSNQSWILLPPGFPTLTTKGSNDPLLSDGMVFLTLASFVDQPYTAIVDANGVPIWASAGTRNDFKKSAADPSHYSVALPVTSGGYRIAELDSQLNEIRSFRLAGDLAPTTDFHDSVLLDDGGAVLMGYDFTARNGTLYTDAIIQVQDAAGVPTMTWNSKDHVDEDAEGLVEGTRHDYAHINSLQRLDNGDILASFRNLSQVMLIAGSDHGIHQQGDVIWRLGGLRNDFLFVDDPEGGPCAQHDATILANGHLQIFDNGSRLDAAGPIASQTADMCPDGTDGPRVARPQTRVSEYVLDTTVEPPTARLVASHAPAGRYAAFAGNAQRLPSGNTFAGWSRSEALATEVPPVATEVDQDDNEIWSLTAAVHFSYRAFKYPAPDRISPEITVTSPADGATVQQGADLAVRFTCADTGGANLDRCDADRPLDGSLTAQPGSQTLTLTATDRAGNTTTRAVTYTVVATPTTTPSPTPTASPTPNPLTAPTADASIKKRGGPWKGADTTRRRGQAVTVRTTSPGRTVAHVRVRNTGQTTGRLVLTGSGSSAWSRVRWFAGGRDVTSRVRAGTYRTPSLDSGDAVRLRLVVRIARTDLRRKRTLRLVAQNSAGDGKDAVRARLVVR